MLHHLDEGRTGPVPQGAGPSALPGRQSLGTVIVPVASTVSWTSPSCATAQEGIGANFISENASSDESRIGVNSLKETHGVTPIAAGTYHTVVVNTQAGLWTVHIAPGEQPVRTG
jgi:hypothetical protein